MWHWHETFHILIEFVKWVHANDANIYAISGLGMEQSEHSYFIRQTVK